MLDPDHPVVARLPTARLLDGVTFAGNRNAVRDVMVGGAWVVEEGWHRDVERVQAEFSLAVKSLLRN